MKVEQCLALGPATEKASVVLMVTRGAACFQSTSQLVEATVGKIRFAASDNGGDVIRRFLLSVKPSLVNRVLKLNGLGRLTPCLMLCFRVLNSSSVSGVLVSSYGPYRLGCFKFQVICFIFLVAMKEIQKFILVCYCFQDACIFKRFFHICATLAQRIILISEFK